MTFTKVQKSKAYFSRFQVKLRRRREGRTDYRQRKRLCTQDKNKYQSPKYRLVVRFTNKFVICQIAYSLIDGDRILAQATSAELERYGLSVGLKNYAAAYCTGLLVARRLLKKVGLDDVYEGNTEVDAEVISCEVGKKTYYVDEVDEDKRPFRALLDVGCRATTTGCRIFGALKGAADGGLDGEYMEYLEEEDNTKYKEQFAGYLAEGIEADGLEELYEEVHEKMREDPSPAEKKSFSPDKSFKRKAKLSHAERKARVQAKKDAKNAELEADE